MLSFDVSGLDSASIREIGPASPSHGQKSAKGAPPYSLYINRPLGRRLATAADALGLRPNQVTMISAAFTFGGIVLLAVGPAPARSGSWSRLVSSSATRSTPPTASWPGCRVAAAPTGEWLDHMIDSVKVSALHLAVLIIAFRQFDLPHPAWLLVPLSSPSSRRCTSSAWSSIDLVARVHRAQYGRLGAGRSGIRATYDPAQAARPTTACSAWASCCSAHPQRLSSRLQLLGVGHARVLVLVSRKWYARRPGPRRDRGGGHPMRVVSDPEVRVGYVPGAWDMFHVGHLNILLAGPRALRPAGRRRRHRRGALLGQGQVPGRPAGGAAGGGGRVDPSTTSSSTSPATSWRPGASTASTSCSRATTGGARAKGDQLEAADGLGRRRGPLLPVHRAHLEHQTPIFDHRRPGNDHLRGSVTASPPQTRWARSPSIRAETLHSTRAHKRGKSCGSP